MDKVKKGPENEPRAEGYAERPKSVQCSGPGCKIVFPAKRGKRFCSSRCRARSHDANRYNRIKTAIVDRKIDELSDADLRILARAVSAKRVAIIGNNDQKPFKPNAAHTKILKHIDEHVKPDQIYVPSIDRLQLPEWGMVDAGRRCRELRAAGILESVRIGRFVGYKRKEN